MRRSLAAVAATMAIAGAGAAAATASPAAASAATASPAAITPVPSINLPQYLGRWYQIAAIPAIYEAVCAKDDTANYTLAADGNVSVANDCVTRAGANYQVTGEGRPDNPPADSTLSVSFLDLFGVKFFPAVPNYQIVGLDPGYAWAVVVSPDYRSAFILSRRPALTADVIATTQSILTANGFDPCRLRFTVQDGGVSSPVRYCSTPASAG